MEERKTGTKEWACKNVNFKKGCKNNCNYCYAAQNANRFGWKPRESWHVMEDSKRKSIPRNTTVMFPSSHDLFIEDYDKIQGILKRLIENHNSILIVSKPRREVIQKLLNEFDFKWIRESLHVPVEFRFSITSASNELSQRYEPNAPLPQERVDCLKMVLAAGVPASVSIEPYLHLPNNVLNLLLENGIKLTDLKEIWIGIMNHGHPSELDYIYSHQTMQQIFNDLKHNLNFRLKDSFRYVIGCDSFGHFN